MVMVDMQCPICPPGTAFTVRYPANYMQKDLAFVARRTPDHQHFRVVCCQGCGLVYANPIISPDTIKQLYEQSNFIVEDQLSNMIDDYITQFKKILPIVPQKNRLLEIGCGNGLFLQRAKQLGFEEVFGFEPSRQAISNAPVDVRGSIVADELKPDVFPKGHFDVICFFQVFDHIIGPNVFLKTVHDYLKPNGVVLAIHHNIRALMPVVLGDKASTYDVSHIHLWDHSTMRKILEKNGFSVLSIRNTANRYRCDHIMRMLPLPVGTKKKLLELVGYLGIGKWSIRASVENMACVAVKKES